jgi:hypothetical protein
MVQGRQRWARVNRDAGGGTPLIVTAADFGKGVFGAAFVRPDLSEWKAAKRP